MDTNNAEWTRRMEKMGVSYDKLGTSYDQLRTSNNELRTSNDFFKLLISLFCLAFWSSVHRY